MEEYLDIVNENGNPTGEKELRSVVHEKGLWHRVAVVYFYRKNEGKIELLVHLRSKLKDMDPNKWVTRFGGHLTVEQTVESSVKEEIKEEIGVDINLENIKKGPVHKYDVGKNREFTHVFYYDASNLENFSFNDGEVQEVKWMNIEEIEQSISANPEIWSGKLVFNKMGNKDIEILKSLI